MIGIIDDNFITNKKGAPTPSLLAMKYYSYFKQQNENVVLLTAYSQASASDKILYFTTKTLEEIPKELFEYSNIEFYGKYLNNEVPQYIHHTRPNPALYNNIVQKRINDGKMAAAHALNILDSAYYQAYAGGELLPVPPVQPRKKFYIYDEDFLSYENCWEILDKIISKNPSSIYMVNPILCHKISQFFYLREEYEKVSRGNKIILDYFVPLHQFGAYFGKYKLKLLGEITKNSDVRIYMGKNYEINNYSENFYMKNLFYNINLLYSYYSRNIPIGAEIYYNPEKINPYYELFKSVKSWANNKDYDITLEEAFTKKQLEKFNQLSERHTIFKQFLGYSKNKLINTRGIWTVL